jgi:hypothetical protein
MANESLQIPGVEVLDLEELQKVDVTRLQAEANDGSCCLILASGCCNKAE